MQNEYIKKYEAKILNAIKENESLEPILDKIYSEGFEDGQNEMTKEEWEKVGFNNDWGLLR